MGLEDELFNKYMLIRQMLDAVRNKNTSKAGPLGDTTRGRGRVLALLKHQDGVSTKDMATVMGIRVSSLNEVLSKMEKEGYVERTPSPDDRRVMLVWLTDKGKAVQLPNQNLPSLLFGSLTQSAQNQMSVYFEQMISALQDDLENEGENVKEARDKRKEFFDGQMKRQPKAKAKTQEASQAQPAQQEQKSAQAQPSQQVSGGQTAQPIKPAPQPVVQQPAVKPAPAPVTVRTADGTPVAPPVPPSVS